MSDMNERDSNQEAVPFFARYLEGQLDYMEDVSEEEMQAMAGGYKGVTRKFPSDQEDHPGGGTVMTKKFPSDQEDHPGGGTVVTQKFPSDQEDHSDRGAMTLKYPSDSDEGIS